MLHIFRRPLNRSFAASASALPSRADAVVVGGGIIGLSTAYHLQQLGFDTVLLEQNKLTSGTSWHAAGLITRFGSMCSLSTEWRKYAHYMYDVGLEAEHGHATGYSSVGFLQLASDGGSGRAQDGADRMEEARRIASFNRQCGVDVQEVSPAEIAELWPLAELQGVAGGVWVPGDGRVNPVDASLAFAAGARQQGALIVEGATVTGVQTGNGSRVQSVTVQMRGQEASGEHTLATGVVVNCAGMWARQLGAMAGVSIPLQAAEHYYLITGKMAGLDKSLPVLEDPASFGYYRPEGDGMLVGLFEPEAAAWRAREGVPSDFEFGELPPDFERMTPFLERAMARVPATADAGMRKFFCGPESFTADLSPLVGQAPELRGYWVAAGLNSVGIISAPGLGRTLARWIKCSGEGHATPATEDVSAIDVARSMPYQSTLLYRQQRVTEALGKVYRCHYPFKDMESARGAKRSPFYALQVEHGAHFRDVSGWESPDWYAVNHPQSNGGGKAGQQPTIDTSNESWGRPAWWDVWAAEHRAAREQVVLIDMSFMAKFLVEGPGVGQILERMSTAAVDQECGVITYCQWCKPDGRLLADVTVSKLATDRFLVVATDSQTTQALAMLREALGLYDEGAAGASPRHITDLTSQWAQLNVQGPHARRLMQDAVPHYDWSDTAFPFRAARHVEIGYAPQVLVTRITYVGELGYELFIPVEFAQHVMELLLAQGPRHGLTLAGLKSLASLRLEKGYRDFGHDIDGTDTLLEAGLGFTMAGSSHMFTGRDAVLEQKARKHLTQRLVSVQLLDGAPLMFHGEPLSRNGTEVGYLRTASYGHTLGAAVGLALVESPQGEKITPKYLREAEWSVHIAGKNFPA